MAIDIKTKVSTDSTDFNRKMDGLKSKTKETAQSTSSAFAGLGSTIAGAFAAGTVLSFSKMLMQSAEDAKEMAESFGITASSLQTLRAVGLFGGVDDPGKIDLIIGKLSKVRADALAGEKAAVDSFKALGVTMLEVAAPIDQLLDTVARQKKSLEGNNDAAKAMYDIFGKNTASMMKFFNEMGMGLENAKEKYRELGIVLSDEYTDKLSDASDKTKLFWAGFKTWASIALAETITGIGKIYKGLTDFADSAKRGFKKGDVSPNMDWIEEEERARNGQRGPTSEQARPQDLEKINAAKKTGIENEIKRLKEERAKLYKNMATADPAQGQAVQNRLREAESALKEHNAAILEQKDKANQALTKLMIEAAKKEQEENGKTYDAQLAQRKKADADALKQKEDQTKAREQLTLLAFDRAKVVQDQASIERGEKLGAFQADAANSLTRIGGMLGAQTSGMSEAQRQTKIQEQLKEYAKDNAMSLYQLTKNTAEANRILQGATE